MDLKHHSFWDMYNVYLPQAEFAHIGKVPISSFSKGSL